MKALSSTKRATKRGQARSSEDPLDEVLASMHHLNSLLLDITQRSKGCLHTIVHACVHSMEPTIYPAYKELMRRARGYLVHRDTDLNERSFTKVIGAHNRIHTSVNNILRAHAEVLRSPRAFCTIHPSEGRVTRMQVEASQDALHHLMYALLQLPENMMARIMGS